MQLIEREQQISEMSSAWNQVKAGRGRIVLVSGEAGIGKTSLIERFVLEQGNSAEVLRGFCDALFSPQPLGPLMDIAFHIQPVVFRQVLAGGDRLSFSRELFHQLQQIKLPVILVIEDLHWADEATLDVVKFLGRRIHQTQTLLILSYRDDEISTTHPLWLLLGDFPPHLTLRIKLPLLSAEAVDQLAQQANQQLEGLYRITGGNPFFVTEIISNQTVGIPSSVRDAVLGRVARLSPEAKRIVELASIIPGAAEAWLIHEILDPAPDAIDECYEHGILILKNNRFTFRHDLARQSVEDSLPVGRARALHVRILTALKAQTNEAIPLARLVHHAAGAGDEEATLNLAPEAALQASALGAHREAIALYNTQLEYKHRLTPEALAELLDKLAIEYYIIGRASEAIQVQEQANRIWARLTRPDRTGDGLRWMSRFHWTNGNRLEAEKYADQAIEMLDRLPPTPSLAMAYSNKSQLHMLAWEIDQAIEWGNKAIGLAEQVAAHEVLVHALTNVGSVEILNNQFEQGQAKISQALRIAREHEMHDHAARCYSNLGSSCVQFRHYPEAQRWLAEGLEYTTSMDIDLHSVYLRGWQAQFFFDTGRWAEAEKQALEALRLSQGNNVGPIPAIIALAHLKVRQGEPSAEMYLERASTLVMHTGELQRIGPLAAARAEAAWWRGDINQVFNETKDAYALALCRKDPWVLGKLAYWMWRAGEKDIPLDRLASPYAHMIRGEWGEAAQAWQQLGCPFEQALALAESDRAGQARALAIFEQLGAKPAVESLRKGLQGSGGKRSSHVPKYSQVDQTTLTAREVEILRLIADGLSNPAMAERLTISIGTVKAHTASIYSKLGVNNRVQAVSRAHDLKLI